MDIDQKLFDELFRKHRKIALVFPRSSKVKNEDYDPFRQTGFSETNQNPLPVKCLTKVLSPSSLTYRELGLVKSGALQIIIQNKDVELIKNSDKLQIGNKEYYVYDDAIGNRFLIFPTQFANFSKILVFQKDTGNA